jgi:hypothetical protein
MVRIDHREKSALVDPCDAVACPPLKVVCNTNVAEENTMTQVTFAPRHYSGTAPQNYERFFVPVIAAPLTEHLIERRSHAPA